MNITPEVLSAFGIASGWFIHVWDRRRAIGRVLEVAGKLLDTDMGSPAAGPAIRAGVIAGLPTDLSIKLLSATPAIAPVSTAGTPAREVHMDPAKQTEYALLPLAEMGVIAWIARQLGSHPDPAVTGAVQAIESLATSWINRQTGLTQAMQAEASPTPITVTEEPGPAGVQPVQTTAPAA